ncbi:MAG: chromosomal replication initiator protein DnaA [Butyrivibrio sp.]|nr:chromosomal replication initiator protein DnaA [Butyrivibrio sp.]
MLDEIIGKWDEILKLMKEDFDIADVSFKTWILPLKPYSEENDVVSIIVPEEQTGLKYIEKKYTTPFKVTISEVMNHEFDIKFISTGEIKKISRQSQNQMDKVETDYSSLGINPKLTFDTFVVGENNNFAHAASLAVAESPGEVYNPLFIYGGVGLGKTHLMQAIANFIMHNNPSLKVQYVTSEVFTNELIESIRTEKNTSNKSFREKYRSVDVLLIDDIQFIIGKESTQDEFFHTFNTLREAKKQIIISSDRPPKNFETLEERLRSRFEWGVLADISPPNYETRMAILHKKEELESYNVDNEILDYIATNVKSNIRELEGSLNKLVAYSRLTHREINLKFAEEVLKDIISPNAQREVTPDLIIQVVADHFGITTADISSQRRSNEIAYPRQIAMYLCRYMTDVPYETIGSYMGKRDHSTVKYGVDKISKELKSDTSLANTIDVIMKKINPS